MIAYMWESGGRLPICFIPPPIERAIFMAWVRKQGILSRRSIPKKGSSPAHWVLDSSLGDGLRELVERRGWELVNSCPPSSETKDDVNPYEILWVRDGAPRFIVIAAYRAMAKEYHPDLHGDDEAKKKMMQKASYAKDLIWKERGW